MRLVVLMLISKDPARIMGGNVNAEEKFRELRSKINHIPRKEI